MQVRPTAGRPVTDGAQHLLNRRPYYDTMVAYKGTRARFLIGRRQSSPLPSETPASALRAPLNVLPRDMQVRIVAGLVDGVSLRAMSRMTGVHHDTIGRLQLAV